ncbi:hypothetical protein [Bradyrhizobium icense]|uniref:DUF551 domain-containing protein n=1 Tax=Bradyrhizobium icense TaxID=1274631 RepID=A0A1B1UD21_9BRAD|nr:hypothetical protein [Bradyrhizobium icense]ANW00657.1 hypothetical protein LMTR13_11260 [Bradyrhizobium icense]
MTEDQVRHMVNRFLNWKLPENFNPDGGISFERLGNKGTPHEYRREPIGTNLLDAVQADAMVCHMIEGLPSDSSTLSPQCGQMSDPMPRGGVEPDWHAESVKLYRQNKSLRKALQEQHDWHLAQGEQDFGDGIVLNMADEYSDSGMCERTTAVLSEVQPSGIQGYEARKERNAASNRSPGRAGDVCEYCGKQEGHSAVCVVNELEALRASVEQQQWRPVETAPKDGTRILAFSHHGAKGPVMSITWWRREEDRKGYVGWGEFNTTYWPPTHWMPLPPIPSTERADG